MPSFNCVRARERISDMNRILFGQQDGAALSIWPAIMIAGTIANG